MPDLADETRSSQHSAATAMEIQPGSVILDRFKVIELLGSGGMGSVFKVQHLHLHRFYALKCINKTSISDLDWRRFEVEAKATGRLDHPNLVKVHDSGLLPEGQPYFVMDLVEGKTLSDIIKARGMLPLLPAIQIFVQVGFALSYAHQSGIIHRDVKPSNIMIVGGSAERTLNNAVKVLDFGLAKITGVDGFNQQTLTKTGEIFGSPLYMSPEQCMGTAVDHRSDLYSFGCVMYETLTGAPPLIGESALSTMLKHQSEKPLSLKEASMGAEYPQQLVAIVEKLLAKDPAERYQDATTLTAELVNLEQQLKLGFAQSLKASSAQNSVLAAAGMGAQFNWLGVVLGIAIGFAAGYFVARPPGMLVEKEPEVKLATPPGIPDAEDQLLVSVEEAKNPQPFSVLTDKGVRIFHFPKFSIGSINTSPVTVQAKGVVPLSDFQPFWFQPTEATWQQPDLLKRFRKDEIKRLDLRTCDTNIEKLLLAASKLSSITSLGLDETDLTDKILTLVDEFPNLETLSIKQTFVTGEAVAKLKCFKKLKYLNIDYCRKIKPIFKHLKEVPTCSDWVLDASILSPLTLMKFPD